jgi:hypothetical protein
VCVCVFDGFKNQSIQSNLNILKLKKIFVICEKIIVCDAYNNIFITFFYIIPDLFMKIIILLLLVSRKNIIITCLANIN